MANHLDLEEQEQLDQLKHFWKQYGNAISWILVVFASIFASWNFYQYWQRTQATQAAAMYGEVERVLTTADTTKIDRAFQEMKERFASTVYAQQAGLLVAKHYQTGGNVNAAKVALEWVVEHASDQGYKAIAKLRLAGVLMESKSFDAALSQLTGVFPVGFDALVADRKGDIYVLQGKKKEAIAEYEKSYKNFAEQIEYRRLVEVKLNSLGIDPLIRNAPALTAINTQESEGKK